MAQPRTPSTHPAPQGATPGWRARIAQSAFGQRVAKQIFQTRGPESGIAFLNQRRVFVLPSSAGLMYAVMLVALLLGSINYSLSLGFALTFFLASVAWVGMFFTFRNLAHLHLRGARVESVFAGDVAQFQVVLINRNGFDRFAVRLRADPGLAPVFANPLARSETLATVPVQIARRGWQTMPRITLNTRFPLGLWHAWAYWQPDLRVLAYPTPAPAGEALPVGNADGSEDASHGGPGSEDYAGIRPYFASDSVRHLAWKAMARVPSGEVLTKLFDGGSQREVWLDLALVPAHMGLEPALCLLTRWVLDCESGQSSYGLRLGNNVIQPARGAAHREACLIALAQYGIPPAR